MIHINNVTKIFNEGTPRAFHAIDDITLHVRKNEITILEGISGSGKSTLLSLIAALYQPSSGEIIIDNEAISRYPENFASAFRRHHIGFIFQKFHLIPTLSVLDNILLPTLPDKCSKIDKAHELIKRFALETKTHTYIKHLSGGEQQRVAIARALINDPKLILADEPTANLDKALSFQLLAYFEAMQQEGKTLLIASHDPLLLEWEKANCCFKLKEGRVL